MTRDADNDHDDKRMDIGQIQMETIRITLVDKQNTKQKQPILYMPKISDMDELARLWWELAPSEYK